MIQKSYQIIYFISKKQQITFLQTVWSVCLYVQQFWDLMQSPGVQLYMKEDMEIEMNENGANKWFTKWYHKVCTPSSLCML